MPAGPLCWGEARNFDIRVEPGLTALVKPQRLKPGRGERLVTCVSITPGQAVPGTHSRSHSMSLTLSLSQAEHVTGGPGAGVADGRPCLMGDRDGPITEEASPRTGVMGPPSDRLLGRGSRSGRG
jgi:hypothetical protein